MSENIKKKKTVSFSQFSNWYACPHKWYRDYILKEKKFEDSLNMSFGTAIHETIQLYLKTLYNRSEKDAARMDLMKYFLWAFKWEVDKKKIPHTPTEFNEFVEDAKELLAEFTNPYNRIRYFPREKWELVSIEDEMLQEIMNNVMLTGFIDIVFREKATGNIRIIDFKTSTRGWTANEKEDFVKTSQLLMYKALYSKKYNIPRNKIDVEFIILKRKLYENARFEQSRIQPFKPDAYEPDINKVLKEFRVFVQTCFTENGDHRIDIKYAKNPGKNKKNCKYCQYAKSGICDSKNEKT